METNLELNKILDSINIDFSADLNQSGIAKELDKEEISLALNKIITDAIKEVIIKSKI